jgi:hypothetical protein
MIGYGNSVFLATHGILARSASGVPVDPDAQAFITAAAITDPTQQTAINTLVVDLKGYSIWSKMKALYPFVGGTSTTHKYNLKDPRDLDAAYRLVFNGGWTHSSTGAKPNGTNGYADTKLNLLSNLLTTSGSFGTYTRTNISQSGYEIAGSSNTYAVITRWVDNLSYYMYGHGFQTVSNTDSRGFFATNRLGSTNTEGYKNGVRVLNVAVATSSLPNSNFVLSSINGTTQFSSKELAFAYISDGLTPTEASNLYTAVQAFQTALSRNV